MQGRDDERMSDCLLCRGPEAATLGSVLARVTRALRTVTGADLVFVNIFGERVAHLHVNLAPHRAVTSFSEGPAC